MVERVIDAHHHLWELSTHHYPWLSGPKQDPSDRIGVGALQRDYLVADFLRDVGQIPLKGSVHVEAAHDPSNPVEETRWVQMQADQSGLPSALVVYAQLQSDDLVATLESHCAFPRVRGVRQMVNWTPSEPVAERDGLLEDPAWKRGIGILARYNLSFDLQIFPHQMELATEVVAAHPELVFVLNHGGFLQLGTSDLWERWRLGIKRLAKEPNVVVKASSFVSVEPVPSAPGLSMYMAELFGAFGADRVLFASNFPVEGRIWSYARMFDAYQHALIGMSSAELDAFYYGNAVRVYRLDSLVKG